MFYHQGDDDLAVSLSIGDGGQSCPSGQAHHTTVRIHPCLLAPVTHERAAWHWPPCRLGFCSAATMGRAEPGRLSNRLDLTSLGWAISREKYRLLQGDSEL